MQSDGFIQKGQELKVCKLKRFILDLNKHLDLGTLDLIKLQRFVVMIRIHMNLVSIRKLKTTR